MSKSVAMQKMKPDCAEAYSNLRMLFEKEGRADEAIESYSKAIELKPDYAEAYSNLGVLLIEQGRVDEAIES